MDEDTPSQPKDKKSTYRISIRMSVEERKILGRKATSAHLSLSRFLVETALSDTVIAPQDKARLRWLLTLFQRTRDRLRALSASPALSQMDAAARQELRATLHLIEALTEEMCKRWR